MDPCIGCNKAWSAEMDVSCHDFCKKRVINREVGSQSGSILQVTQDAYDGQEEAMCGKTVQASEKD